MKNGKTINCTNCNTSFYCAPWRAKQNPKYCSYKCYWNNKSDVPWNKGTVGYSKANKTSFKANGHIYKGDLKDYKKLHHLINKLYGKPDTCEECGNFGLKGRLIHWANLSGDYNINREDWKRLCAKCHFKLDYKHRIGFEYGSHTL